MYYHDHKAKLVNTCLLWSLTPVKEFIKSTLGVLEATPDFILDHAEAWQPLFIRYSHFDHMLIFVSLYCHAVLFQFSHFGDWYLGMQQLVLYVKEMFHLKAATFVSAVQHWEKKWHFAVI